ncbi:MAG: hypothetical protein QW076_01770 [Candidatus Anstonellales archaeon]
MNMIDLLYTKFKEQGECKSGFLIERILYQKEPFEFEGSTFKVVTRDDSTFFAEVKISKRLVLLYAQNLLQKRGILLLPELIETSSVIFLTEILNRIEEEYKIVLEISPFSDASCITTTDILVNVRYQNIVAPVLIKLNTIVLYKLILQSNYNPEEFTDFNVILKGEKNISLKLIGRLKVGDFIRVPSDFDVVMNGLSGIHKVKVYLKEETMENNVVKAEELPIPIVFKIELGSLTLSQIRDILYQDKISEILGGKECRVMIGNAIIATGDINENHIRISKVFI